MIKLNGYPFLEKEDSEGNDDAFLQPSAPSTSRFCFVWVADACYHSCFQFATS